MNADTLALAVMDDDGYGCAITTELPAAGHIRPAIGCTACEATYNGDPGQWRYGCALTSTPAPAGYVVIFRFGRTEVESIQRHDTWVSALAEASCPADEGADEAWIESTAKAGS